MCELAASPFDGACAWSRVEEELGGESYTLRTVQGAASSAIPSISFALVIGADLVAERERWHGWPELKDAGAVHRRRAAGHRRRRAGIELPPVSSTIVRERVARGEPVDALVAAARGRLHPRARALYR